MKSLEKVFSGRWIAGPYVSDAITIAEKLHNLKITPILNFLGEELCDIDEINNTVKEYMTLISHIKKISEVQISIKPTQIGLLIGEDELFKNYNLIIKKAQKYKIFTWLDMESYSHVDKTIDLYLENKYKNTGICIQSYLKRSNNDIRKLIKNNASIRLVKGAYSEKENISYNRKNSTVNYFKLMKLLFEKSGDFMLATHDISIIKESFNLCVKYKKEPQYAMLYGIRNKLALEMASTHKICLYVPFGEKWISYSYRRFKELSNISLVLRSLLEAQKIN